MRIINSEPFQSMFPLQQAIPRVLSDDLANAQGSLLSVDSSQGRFFNLQNSPEKELLRQLTLAMTGQSALI